MASAHDDHAKIKLECVNVKRELAMKSEESANQSLEKEQEIRSVTRKLELLNSDLDDSKWLLERT